MTITGWLWFACLLGVALVLLSWNLGRELRRSWELRREREFREREFWDRMERQREEREEAFRRLRKEYQRMADERREE